MGFGFSRLTTLARSNRYIGCHNRIRITVCIISSKYFHESNWLSSLDRYRKGLKGTWKDNPLPANGATYDLGPHLIDQALCLFGRPTSITAFIQNTRCIGNLEVDDTVSQHPDSAMTVHDFSAASSQYICTTRPESGRRTP